MVAQSCTFLTLAGEMLSIEVDLNAITGLQGFENAVLAKLPYLGRSSTLGVRVAICANRHPPSPGRPHTEQTESQPLLLCDCSAMFCRGDTQRATQRGRRGNQSAAW